MKELDNFFLTQTEPNKSCFLALRDIILNFDPEISISWKYSLPFFTFRNKMFCYLWANKKTNMPYIGFVEGNRLNHSSLIKENRKRMKIFICNPNQDLPIDQIRLILHDAIDLYKSGKIKTPKS